MLFTKSCLRLGTALLALVAASSCGYKHRKYENPIAQDTGQPDKLLFDKAIKDLEKQRYEIARITLQTLLTTYESSEYAAKAKLAVADTWRREGGARGYAQAEAEYKDFILFYPQMEEAAESQMRLCEMHYQQMDKADRDPNQALRSEQECRQMMVQFPNSKFVPQAEQLLRNVQEVIASGEHSIGNFYRSRGNFNAAANRYGGVADQYPLFSQADESLWFEAEAFNRLGAGWRAKESEALVRIVRDYPLSTYVPAAKDRLGKMEVRIPEADPEALARMQYNLDNRVEPGMLSKSFSFMRRGPDTWTAAKNGAPQMEKPKQNIPPLTPAAGGAAGFQGDVTVAPVTNSSALDRNPDARPASPGPNPAPAK
jgi:outer membrane protein assembly factor BamD